VSDEKGKVEFAELSGELPIGLFRALGNMGREFRRNKRIYGQIKISRQFQLGISSDRFAAGKMAKTAFDIIVDNAFRSMFLHRNRLVTRSMLMMAKMYASLRGFI